MFRSLTTLGLFTVLLADVAPSGSCGNDSRPPAALYFSVPDCSCLPARLRVEIEGQPGEDLVVECGRTVRIEIEGRGDRRFVVKQGSTIWHEDTWRGALTPVTVSCPRL